MALSQKEKGRAFKALHEAGCFLIPNPWDAGSTRVLEGMGFSALATTSAGFAFTLGRADGAVSLDEVAAHVAALCAASDLPVSVDLENGYGHAPEDAATAILRAAGAGAVGGSIEDWSGEKARGLYDIDHAAERVAAAVEAARGLDFPFMVTARAENLFRGSNDFDDVIARLQAYERAGADVLYAPGLKDIAQVSAVCAAVAKPVNVLANPALTVKEIAAAGGRRISAGGALAFAALGALMEGAAEMLENGTFGMFEMAAKGARARQHLAHGEG